MTTHGGTWSWLRSGAAAVGLGVALAVGALGIAEPADRSAESALMPAAVVVDLAAEPEAAATRDRATALPREARSPAAAGRLARDPGERESWRLEQRPGDGYLWSRGHESGR